MVTNDQQTPDANPEVEIEPTRERYVAYCDILGFSNMVASEFDETIQATKKLADLLSGMEEMQLDVKITMYSDSILVVGERLRDVLNAVQGLWFFALASDFMIRGSITKGRYWEMRTNSALVVISDALVRAVQLEKQVSIPAVVIADDVEIPEELWYTQFAPDPSGAGTIVTSLLHFRDRNIVNPFNRYWLLSAGARANRLMQKYPKYKDKYLWFIALHQAVTNRHQLVPQEIFEKLVRSGMVTWVPLGSDGYVQEESNKSSQRSPDEAKRIPGSPRE